MKFDSFRITSHHSRMISGKLYIIEAVYILLYCIYCIKLNRRMEWKISLAETLAYC